MQVGNGSLKLPADQLTDVLGKPHYLLKTMLTSLQAAGKEGEQQGLLMKEQEEGGFEELIKSLVTPPPTTAVGYVYFKLIQMRSSMLISMK